MNWKKQEKQLTTHLSNAFKNPWIYYVIWIIVAIIAIELAFFLIYTFSPISDIAVVVSSSMVHSNANLTFYGWLEFHGFSLNQIKSWPFQNGINPGDIVIAFKTNPSEIKVGDVIIFNSPVGQIIHRVIYIYKNSSGVYFTTKGDANPYIISFERNFSASKVVGVVKIVIPYVGYPKYLIQLLIDKLIGVNPI